MLRFLHFYGFQKTRHYFQKSRSPQVTLRLSPSGLWLAPPGPSPVGVSPAALWEPGRGLQTAPCALEPAGEPSLTMVGETWIARGPRPKVTRVDSLERIATNHHHHVSLRTTMGTTHFEQSWETHPSIKHGRPSLRPSMGDHPLRLNMGDPPLRTIMGTTHFKQLWETLTAIKHGRQPLRLNMGDHHFD